ncbi:hypothetical protein ACJ41O_001424 [Fusarium nematophilum]
MLDLDPGLYNVAWIAPLEIEAQSALQMLDERHHGRFPMSRGDDHVFHAGSIFGHNVVIATLPAGQEYGTGSAAALASQVKKSFPNLWFGLLVGVAAGLPDLSRKPPRDIRLGDVLVALPDGESAGLVAYDLGKATGADGFQPLRLGHVLATTETIVRSAIGSIKLRAPNDAAMFLPHYEKIKNMRHSSGTFVDPGQVRDKLYQISDCGLQREVERPLRPDTERTRVWYGSIGSGEKLMKNARQRNELRDKYNIIGLEMEAAGTMNRIAVGVVRGVCDYGDEHKNKDWQPYAAAMAAVYAKAILGEISPQSRTRRSQVESGENPGNSWASRIQKAIFRGVPCLLGGLPLAIAQAGSYIFNKYCTYLEYCDEFRRSPQTQLSYELEQLPTYRRPIWTTFSLSLSRIQNLSERGSTQAVELLRTLSFLHHEGVQERLFQEAWSNMKKTPQWSQYVTLLDSSSPRWDTPDLRAAFEILCRYSLLDHTLPPARQYSMHRLVKTICRETLSQEEQGKYAFRAMSMMAVALSGITTSLPWIENPSGFELRKSLLPHIRACAENRFQLIFQGQHQSQDIKAEMLLLCAKAYSSTGHYSDAQNILREVSEALGISTAVDTTSSMALRIMEQTAACAACLGEHMKALELREKILDVYQTAACATCSRAAQVAMMNLADSLWMTGSRKEALNMSQEVLCRRERVLETGDLKLQRTRRKVAEYLHASFRRLDALKLRVRVFKISESRENPSETESLDTLSTFNALADSYQWDGQWLEALALREKVHAGRSKILGADHPDTLLAYDRLLGIKSRHVRTTEGLEEICQCRELAVETWARMLGDEHPHTLEARVNLGHSYSALGQLEKALEEQRAVLEIRKRRVKEQQLPGHESNYLSSMGNVANILSKMGHSREALTMRKSALKEAEESYGANDRTTLRLNHHVATCHGTRDTTDSRRMAVQMRRSILENQKSNLGEKDADVLSAMSLLAADLARLHERDEAIQIRRHLMSMQPHVLGLENHETLDNLKKLALILTDGTSWLEHTEAVVLMERVERAQIQRLGEDNPRVYSTRIELYRIYRNARRDIEATYMAKKLRLSAGARGGSGSSGHRELFMISRRAGSDPDTDDEVKVQRGKQERLDSIGRLEQEMEKLPRTPEDPALGGIQECGPRLLGMLQTVFEGESEGKMEYPSSSEKYGGESGSEASDSGSIFGVGR